MSVLPLSTEVTVAGEPIPRVGFATKFATLLAVVIPFGAVFAAAVLTWGWGFHWVELGLLLGMYLATGLGITVGFHRLFAHRAFEASPVVKATLAALGSMALQRSPIKWTAFHRYHHQHSDQKTDVHSPHHSGRGVLGVLRGFWHSHVGWLFDADPPGLNRYVKDMQSDRLLRFMSRYWLVWVVLGFVIPTVLGWALIGGWRGAALGLVWGGLIRIFLVHHITWSINSVCHLWGRQPYASRDESRNNVLFGILGLGEGWHNNHHAFPTSARHGLKWWQLDISYLVIRSLELCGLVRNVKIAKPLDDRNRSE